MFNLNNRKIELETHARLLMEVIQGLLKDKAGITISGQPRLTFKPITEFNERMDADGRKKFPESCHVSYINFYRDAKDMQRHNTLGALVMYIETEYAPSLLRKLQYSFSDGNPDDDSRDYAGTICNLIAGMFKTALAQSGYCEIEMSPFTTYHRRAFSGVDFCYDEYTLVEIEFDIEGRKRLVIELTLGKIPQR